MITVLGFNFLGDGSPERCFGSKTDQIGGAGMEKDVLLRITDLCGRIKTENGTKQKLSTIQIDNT